MTTASVDPVRLLAEYRKAIAQLGELQGRLAYKHVPDDQQEHAGEASARIMQMRFALKRCKALQADDVRNSATVRGIPAGQLKGALLRRYRRRRGRVRQSMSFYAEAFYYFAHRAAKCLSRVDGFKIKPVGTRDVRNKLIEHPVAFYRNFIFDRPEGVRVKPFRREGASRQFPDAGLYPNAKEFVDLLLGRLAAADAVFRKEHPEAIESARLYRARVRKRLIAERKTK